MCTQDDLNEYGFQTFIDSIKNAVPPMEEFNQKAAKLGNTTAQLDLGYNAMLSESERERNEYVKRILEDQEESRRALRRIGIDLLTELSWY